MSLSLSFLTFSTTHATPRKKFTWKISIKFNEPNAAAKTNSFSYLVPMRKGWSPPQDCGGNQTVDQTFIENFFPSIKPTIIIIYYTDSISCSFGCNFELPLLFQVLATMCASPYCKDNVRCTCAHVVIIFSFVARRGWRCLNTLLKSKDDNMGVRVTTM